jgi:hypothetical protein
VALALSQDRLNLSDFTPAAIARPDIRRLLPLTTLTARSREEEQAARRWLPHKVVIRLKNGSELKAEQSDAKGSAVDPFDDVDRASKFADCCGGRLGAGKTSALYDALTGLDNQADIDFLAQAPCAAPSLKRRANDARRYWSRPCRKGYSRYHVYHPKCCNPN